MTNTNVETQPCGCQSITDDIDEVTTHRPCLAHALEIAGEMLQCAGLRITEALEAEQEARDERAARAAGTMGASD